MNTLFQPQSTSSLTTRSASARTVRPTNFGWERYVGLEGRILGMNTFGASAPLEALQQKFGFTVDHVVAAARDTINHLES